MVDDFRDRDRWLAFNLAADVQVAKHGIDELTLPRRKELPFLRSSMSSLVRSLTPYCFFSSGISVSKNIWRAREVSFWSASSRLSAAWVPPDPARKLPASFCSGLPGRAVHASG